MGYASENKQYWYWQQQGQTYSSWYDDHGSLIPLEELELCISANDDSIIQTLKNHSYACVFTEGNIDDNNSTIILANGMTMDELNKEKSRTKDKCMCES
jgi:hypothetical protein